jgi:hypothetical protein
MYAQQGGMITGKVIDAATGEPVHYAHVLYVRTMHGVVTLDDGAFTLSRHATADTLQVSAVGYKTQLFVRPPDTLLVKLQPEQFDIDVITVRPDDGPIRRLLRNIADNRDRNNPEKLSSYAYRKYSKWDYRIVDVSERLLKSRLLRSYSDAFRTEANGNRYLPFYFSEQIADNEVQKNPPRQRSTVLADKTHGVGILEELRLAGFTSALNMSVNFYDSYIQLYSQNFISPIAPNGWFYYQYFLADSISRDGYKEYVVHFQPRRNSENTFKGHFITENRFFSIVDIEAQISGVVNINFLKSFKVNASYGIVEDSIPCFRRHQTEVLFDVIPYKNMKNDLMTINYTHTTIVDNFTTNTGEMSLNVNARYETLEMPDAMKKDSTYWDENRKERLTPHQKDVNLLIDSLSKLGIVNTASRVAQMTMTGYYDLGKFELGPYYRAFNINEVEGMNFFFGGRTSDEISNRLFLSAGAGYGVRNKKFNGMAGIGYKFPSTFRQLLNLSFDDKMIRHGESEDILYLWENSLTTTENNIVAQMMKRDKMDEIYREQKFKISYEREWRPGLQQSLAGTFRRHYSPEFYPFMRSGSQPVGAVATAEIAFDTRLSFREQYIDLGFNRMYQAGRFPVLHFTVAAGHTFIDAATDDWYGRLFSTLKHDIYFGQTRLNCVVESGIYFGRLPYTMLNIPRGNETMGYFTYDFNMLNYLEFVHDKFTHLYATYHLNGFLLRRIPLISKLNLREVMSVKVMVGDLSSRHQTLLDLPAGVSAMQNPYIELGAGFENILRILQIQAVWRVHPTSIYDAPEIGIRAKFYLGM